MTQGEFQNYLREVIKDEWPAVWQKVCEHRSALLRAVQRAAEELYCEPGLSHVRFRLELEHVVRLLEERGP